MTHRAGAGARHQIGNRPCAAVACRHQLTAAPRRRQLVAAYAAGERRILVAAGEEWEENTPAAHLLIAGPPLTPAALARLARRAAAQAGPVTLHFLYGPDDLRAAANILDQTFPDRTAMGWLYLALKQAAGPDGAVPLDIRRLTRAIARLSGAAAHAAAVAAGLKILAEIGLLCRPDGADGGLLPPAPARKLALDDSPTYRQGRRAKEEFSALARRLARSALADLWKQALNEI